MFKGLLGLFGGWIGKLPKIDRFLGLFGLKNLLLISGVIGTFAVAYFSVQNFIDVLYKEHRRVYEKITTLENEILEKDIQNQSLSKRINSLNTQMMVLNMGFE